MSISYQSLLGESTLDATFVEVQDIQIDGNFVLVPNAAHDYVLSCKDASGTGTWADATQTLSLTGDVNGLLSANHVDFVGTSTAAHVHSAELLANAATNLNTSLTIVKRDASGNFVAGTMTGNLNGTSTTCVVVPALSGDVTTNGSTNATTVAFVGTSTAANVHAAEVLANAATNLNTANQIVKRDASGNFIAGTMTGNLNGTSTTCTTIPNLTGMVTSVGNATTVVTNANLTGECTSSGNATTLSNSAVTGKVLTGFVSGAGTISATDSLLTFANKITGNVGAPTNLNTANQIVKRDASGNFVAGTMTGNLTGVASDVANAAVIAKILTGFVSGAGTILATDSILTAIQKLNGNVTGISTLSGDVTGSAAANTVAKIHGTAVSGASSANTANNLVLRDGSGNFSTNAITADNAAFTTTLSGGYNVRAGYNAYQVTNGPGTYLGWNRTLGTGISQFMNQNGGGSAGGFEWLQYNNSNVLTGTLMTLDANANLSVPTSIASSQMAASQVAQLGSGTFAAPTGQGSWISWNRTNGGAEFSFMNQAAGTTISNAFEWLLYSATNILTNTLMTLSKTGLLTVTDVVTNSTTLNGTWSYPWGSTAAGKIRLVLIGKMCTLVYNSTNSTAPGATPGPITFSSQVPSWATPDTSVAASGLNMPCITTNNGNSMTHATFFINVSMGYPTGLPEIFLSSGSWNGVCSAGSTNYQNSFSYLVQ